MSWLEIIALLFYLLSVVFTTMKSVWTWPAGIIGVIAYMLFFIDVKFYADAGLQVIYFVQCIYGWLFWQRNIKKYDEFRIRRLSAKNSILTLSFIGLVTALLSYFLQKYTDDKLPFWDSFASVLSLVANWLLARKIFENWILWIISDLLYIGIFYQQGYFISFLFYIIFLALSINGYFAWKKELSPQKA